MRTQIELTQETLKSILLYDVMTGIFTWKIKPANCVDIGDVAGWLGEHGYIEIGYKRKHYKAHRLAWLYVYGTTQVAEIDHIDGVRSNNKIANLRAVSHRRNQQNRTTHRLGRLPGAIFDKRRGKWQAKILISGKGKHIGYFNTEQEASAAYLRLGEEL